MTHGGTVGSCPVTGFIFIQQAGRITLCVNKVKPNITNINKNRNKNKNKS